MHHSSFIISYQYASDIQVIRRHQQLQAMFRRYVHVRGILDVFILQIVIEVFADFLKYNATTKLSSLLFAKRYLRVLDSRQSTPASGSFGEITYTGLPSAHVLPKSMRPIGVGD